LKKRVFSGIQPTGNIHIGNYLGATRHWVANQDNYNNIFCIVDLHAITVPQDPVVLKVKIREVTGLLLAAGIDPERSIVFIQSHVSAHSELAWILSCFIPMGWMQRMTQFKEKSAKQREQVSVGLFDYPAHERNRYPQDKRRHDHTGDGFIEQRLCEMGGDSNCNCFSCCLRT
jgi:tryptophanyl-tRNA synthetase